MIIFPLRRHRIFVFIRILKWNIFTHHVVLPYLGTHLKGENYVIHSNFFFRRRLRTLYALSLIIENKTTTEMILLFIAKWKTKINNYENPPVWGINLFSQNTISPLDTSFPSSISITLDPAKTMPERPNGADQVHRPSPPTFCAPFTMIVNPNIYCISITDWLMQWDRGWRLRAEYTGYHHLF